MPVRDLTMTFENAHATRRPLPADDGTLKITVVYTSDDATLFAMQRAAGLTGKLPAKLTLIYPQIVPFQRPLTSPPVQPEFTEQHLREIAGQVPMDIDIRICLCRDPQDALRAELPPQSVIVLGGRKRWWRTAERILAQELRRGGHEVILAEME